MSKELNRDIDFNSENTVAIVMPVRAVPKARTSHGRYGQRYTPKRTRDFEKLVSIYAEQAMKGREQLKGALGLSITFTFKVFKSWNKKDKELALQQKILPVSNVIGDISNLIKSVEDGMNGIVYPDDRQIVSYKDIDMIYGEEDLIVIKIFKLT